MNRNENPAPEDITRAVIENRKTLSLWGIENIVSFDENFVVLEEREALITADGEGLQILKMDTESGEVVIVGRINGLVYSDKRPSAKKFGGLFRSSKRQ